MLFFLGTERVNEYPIIPPNIDRDRAEFRENDDEFFKRVATRRKAEDACRKTLGSVSSPIPAA